MDRNNEYTDYSVKRYRQRTAKTSDNKKIIPIELGSMYRKKRNARAGANSHIL